MTTPGFSQYNQKNKAGRGNQTGPQHFQRRDDHSNSHRRQYEQQPQRMPQAYMHGSNTQYGASSFKPQSRSTITPNRSQAVHADMVRLPASSLYYPPVQSYQPYENMVVQNRTSNYAPTPTYNNPMNHYVSNQHMGTHGYTQQMNIVPLQQQHTNMAYTTTIPDRTTMTNRTATYPSITPQPDTQNMNNLSKSSNVKSSKRKSKAIEIVDPDTKKAVDVNDTKPNNSDSNRERSALYTKPVDNDERHRHQAEVKAAAIDHRDIAASSALAHNIDDMRAPQQDKDVEIVKNTDNVNIDVEEKPIASGSSHSPQIHLAKSDDEGVKTATEEHTTAIDNEIDQPNMVLNNGDNEAVNNQVQDKTDGVNDAQKENSDDQQSSLPEKVVITNDVSAPVKEDNIHNINDVIEGTQTLKVSDEPADEPVHKSEKVENEQSNMDEQLEEQPKATEASIVTRNEESVLEDDVKINKNDDQYDSDDDNLEEDDAEDDDEDDEKDIDDGNLQYDREFLLKFRAMAPAQTRPDLPNVECVLKEGSNVGDVIRHPADFLLPQFTRQKSSGSGKGRGQRGSKKIIDHSISNDITFQKADNKWQRPSEEHDEVKIVLNKVKGILNKLTPQKFDVLVNNFKELPIDNEAKMIGSIDLIFEKAITEPGFNRCYAELCSTLQNISIPKEGDGSSSKSNIITLRRLILNKCQKEFRKDKTLGISRKEEYDKKFAECQSEDERRRVQEDYDIEEIKARKRSLGNVKFIGELFKLGMLKENIIHDDCIKKLLYNNDEDSLESLCGFMTTVGKRLDKPESAGRMDSYFERLRKLTQKKDKICARIRFMIQDVIDLRQNSWVPRRADNNPRKIDEINREVEKEAALQEEQLRAQQAREKNMPRNRGRGNDMDDRRQNFSSGRQRMEKNEINLSKFKSASTKTDENITLGPPSWINKNSGNSGASPRMSNINNSQSKDFHPKYSKPQGMTSTVKERDTVQRKRKVDVPNAKEVKKLIEVTPEKLNQIIKEVLENFVNNEDYKGSVQELPDKSNFVDTLINHVLEKKAEDRKIATSLLQSLCEDSVIVADEYLKGFSSILDMADDVEIDVPHIYNYLAKMISPLLPNYISLKQVIEIGKNNVTISQKGRTKLICGILTSIKELKGEAVVSRLWADSGVSVADFTSQGQSSVFGEYHLEFLLQSEVNTKELEDAILHALQSDFDNSDQLLSKYASKYRLEDLLYGVTIAICRSCMEENNWDEGRFKRNIVVLDGVLKKFSDTNQCRLACLSHIAKFVSGLSHPSDLLAKIFNNIYDFGSVNEATFKAWIDERKLISPEIINSLSHFKDRIEKANVESN